MHRQQKKKRARHRRKNAVQSMLVLFFTLVRMMMVIFFFEQNGNRKGKNRSRRNVHAIYILQEYACTLVCVLQQQYKKTMKREREREKQQYNSIEKMPSHLHCVCVRVVIRYSLYTIYGIIMHSFLALVNIGCIVEIRYEE